MTARLLLCFGLILGGVDLRAADPPKVVDRHFDVKKLTKYSGPYSFEYGVVTKVTNESITVQYPDTWDKTKSVTTEVFPVDLLAQGKILENIPVAWAYRWSDVKVGDTVSLETMYDEGEKKRYCQGVGITRRRGEKLPQSQKPKGDKVYAKHTLLNDIDNGLDVNDDDIATAYPTILTPKDPKQPNGLQELFRAGGLPKEYQAKLDAIREKAKKEKDLKAAPPDKK